MKFCTGLALTLVLMAAVATAQRMPEREPFREKDPVRVAETKFFLKIKEYKQIPYGAVEFGIPEIDAILRDAHVRGIRRLVEERALYKRAETSGSGIERLYIVAIEPMETITSYLNRFKGLASVEYAAPYRIYEWAHTPDDPGKSSQWAVQQMNLQNAWDITTGDSTICIGIIDSGVDMDHEDLLPNLYRNPGEWGVNGELANNNIDDDQNGFVDDWRGWDLVGTGSVDNLKPDNDPEDSDAEHGTSVAGCASAATGNGKGVCAPGYRTKILPVKVGADYDRGVEAGYEGIAYAVQMGVRVLNCSWEIDKFLDPPMRDLVEYAFDSGTLVTVAAGNSGERNDLRNGHHIITRTLYVGSSKEGGYLSTFSNYGVSVDVCAPGEDVYTTKKGNEYGMTSGTSFAGPHAAGVAALVFAVHPDWTPDQVAKQLRVTSAEFSAGRTAWDYGMIDAYQAVSMNNTMQDVPGIRLKRLEVRGPGGDRFTAPGQTATVTAVFENLLAPCSGNTSASMLYATSDFTVSTDVLQIGALGTMDSVKVSFEMTLDANFDYSETWSAIQFTITDGEYVDYDLGYVDLYTADGWHTSYEPRRTHEFKVIRAVDENNVWAVARIGYFAYTVIRSTDGGVSWMNARGLGFPDEYVVSSIAPVDGNTAFIGTWSETGYTGSVYRTTDGGMIWERTAVSAFTRYVNGIHMFDAMNGIFVGDALSGKWGVGKTSDGGENWYQIQTPPDADMEYGSRNAIDFIGDYGWFGTKSGKAYVTSDRGETWDRLELPSVNVSMISLRAEDDALVRFYETAVDGHNIVGYTSNGGTSWTSFSPVIATEDGFAEVARGGKTVWIGNDFQVHSSNDNGKSWHEDLVPYGIDDEIRCAESFSTSTTTYVWMGGAEIYRTEVPFEPYTVGVERPGTPAGFTMHGWPNPAVAGTQMHLDIAGAQQGRYDVFLYDIFGRCVHRQNADLMPGKNSITIVLHDVAPGVYTAALRNRTLLQTVRMTVLK